MKGIIKIHSISDVITNSSSEVFVLNIGDNLIKYVKKQIKKYHKSHMWGYGNDITELPSDVKELLGGEEAVEKAASLLNETSGTAGDIDIYDWEDAYKGYCNLHNVNYTPEQWAEHIGINLEEIKNVIMVDVDWASHGTINMLKTQYNIMFQGDGYYDSKFYDAFCCAHYNEEMD